jgi:hypothetical protein
VSHQQRPAVAAEAINVPRGHFLTRVPAIGLGVGVVAAILSYVTAGSPKAFGFSWLFSCLFFLSLSLGALYFVLIHYATQAGWGIVVRRLAENVMVALPLFALLFVPVLLLRGEIFSWIHLQATGHDHMLAAKQAYLNEPFFLARAVIYFVAWSGIAIYFFRASRRQDTSSDLAISLRLKRLAGPALIVVALTQTFAAFDWIMSLDAHWYSTMFGVYWFAGCFVSFFAFLTLLVVALRRYGLLADVISIEHFHDLGKMLFAFTVFWAYIGFSQFFLIWYANIPEETIFFRERLHGSWSSVTLLLSAGHFVIPFFFLMPRTIKRNPKLLALGAGWLLFMHLVDIIWLVLPAIHAEGLHIGLSDVFAFIAVGSLFKAGVCRMLTGAPLVPVGDPRLPESLSFENI